MADFLTRDNKELRAAIFDFLRDPLYAPNYHLSMAGFRELTSQRMAKFVGQRFFSVFDYTRDPLKFQAALECLNFCDYRWGRRGVVGWGDGGVAVGGAWLCWCSRWCWGSKSLARRRECTAAFRVVVFLPCWCAGRLCSGCPPCRRRRCLPCPQPGHQGRRALHAVRRHHRQAGHREAPPVSRAPGGLWGLGGTPTRSALSSAGAGQEHCWVAERRLASHLSVWPE